MSRTTTCFWILLACGYASGCASLLENGLRGSSPPPVYAGVGVDAKVLAEVATTEPSTRSFFGGLAVMADLPLSAAADTLFLPECLAWNYRYAQKKAAEAWKSAHEGSTQTLSNRVDESGKTGEIAVSEPM